MIRNSVNGVDILCWNILRNVSGGDVSTRNLAVAEYMLDVFIEFRFLIGTAFLSKNYLHHIFPTQAMARQKFLSCRICCLHIFKADR
jgi:Integrator complex subunit 3 N-terminal